MNERNYHLFISIEGLIFFIIGLINIKHEWGIAMFGYGIALFVMFMYEFLIIDKE